LKKYLGPKAIPESNLSLVTPEGYIKIEPTVVLDTRALPHRDEVVTQWLAQWENLERQILVLFQPFTTRQSINGGHQLLLVDKKLVKRGSVRTT
jgi:hypothetical protein